MTELPVHISRIVTLTMAIVLCGLVSCSTAFGQEETAQPTASDSKPADDGALKDDDTAKEEAKEQKPQKVVVAEKRVELALPAHWKKRERQNNVIEMEFAVLEREPKEGEKEEEIPAGRVTLSSSGGTVDQNMRRWIGQFRLGRDDDGEDAVEQEVIEIEGANLHLLDIAGTYFDSPGGPFGPKIERPNYRMLGAIIEIEKGPLYFVKFYGPQKVVEANVKQFRKAVRTATIHAASDDKAPGDDESSADTAAATPKPNE